MVSFHRILEFGDPVGGSIRCAGYTARGHALYMGVFAPEYGHQPCGAGLLPQGCEVMGNGQQVGFRRKLVSRVAPVAVGKRSELAAVPRIF